MVVIKSVAAKLTKAFMLLMLLIPFPFFEIHGTNVFCYSAGRQERDIKDWDKINKIYMQICPLHLSRTFMTGSGAELLKNSLFYHKAL